MLDTALPRGSQTDMGLNCSECWDFGANMGSILGTL